MNKADVIKNQLDKAGRTVCLKDGDWTSMPFKACISHLWRKKTSSFEPKYTELGKSFFEYYLYTGPYDHNITVLTDDAVLEANGEKFEFKCVEAVNFGGDTVYYTGVLRRLTGDDFNEN